METTRTGSTTPENDGSDSRDIAELVTLESLYSAVRDRIPQQPGVHIDSDWALDFAAAARGLNGQQPWSWVYAEQAPADTPQTPNEIRADIARTQLSTETGIPAPFIDTIRNLEDL